MKKMYLMAAFLGASTFAFNQIQNAPTSFKKENNKKSIYSLDIPKAEGEVLWSSDFSDTSEWVIGRDEQQAEWIIGDTNDVDMDNARYPDHPGYFDLISSTTMDNGFAFITGIQYLLAPPVLAQNSWVQMAESVDLSDYEVVTFKFEQAYRAFNHDKTLVEVSLDGGTTWEQSIDVNSAITANNSTTELVAYRNFNVNNSTTVKFRFRWSSMTVDNAYGSGYGWMVDDVEIQSLSDYDLSKIDHVYGSNVTDDPDNWIFYYQIPETQVAPIGAATIVKNQGSADQTNVIFRSEAMDLSDSSVVYNGASDAIDISVNEEKSISINEGFIPEGQGRYSMSFSIEADQEDDVPSNNVYSKYNFTVGEYIYARDNSTVPNNETGNFGYLSGALDEEDPSSIEVGNVFHIFEPTEVFAIDFRFGDIISEGSLVFGHILNDELVQVQGGETESYEVMLGDNFRYKTLVFDNPVLLTPGEYVVTVTNFDIDFSVATGGKSAPQTTFIYYTNEDTWYYTTSTPIVRLNLDPNAVGSVGLAENNVNSFDLVQYPNPFSNETTIEFNLEESSKVSYQIVDVTGKVVTDASFGNMNSGNHQVTIDGSSFANGIYYLNFKVNNTQVSRKIVVNK